MFADMQVSTERADDPGVVPSWVAPALLENEADAAGDLAAAAPLHRRSRDMPFGEKRSVEALG